MAWAQHKPCQDQFDMTLELGFIDILHAKVDLGNCIYYHILIPDPNGEADICHIFSNHDFNKKDLCLSTEVSPQPWTGEEKVETQ